MRSPPVGQRLCMREAGEDAGKPQGPPCLPDDSLGQRAPHRKWECELPSTTRAPSQDDDQEHAGLRTLPGRESGSTRHPREGNRK